MSDPKKFDLVRIVGQYNGALHIINLEPPNDLRVPMGQKNSPPQPMRVIVMTRYDRLGASSRLRFMQFQEILQKHGIELVFDPLFSDQYVREMYARSRRKLWFAARDLLKRMLHCAKRLFANDVIWLEKEMFPYLPFPIERVFWGVRKRVVVDIDDAIFHQYDSHPSRLVRQLLSHKIASVFKSAVAATPGNQYLAKYACRAGNQHVTVVPTVIDLSRYPAKKEYSPRIMPRICWIGSPATSQYLNELMDVLESLHTQNAFEFVVIGAGPLRSSWEFVLSVPWTEASESSLIQSCDIGVMPLPDSPWERGKCGYKLIQYMACGLPVVAAAVGANLEIVSADVGFLVKSPHEWRAALTQLFIDPNLRRKMGLAARKRVEEHYCTLAVAQVVADVLQDCRQK